MTILVIWMDQKKRSEHRQRFKSSFQHFNFLGHRVQLLENWGTSSGGLRGTCNFIVKCSPSYNQGNIFIVLGKLGEATIFC
jgi:hypothetical protein